MLDLDDLERLAKAATPGHRTIHGLDGFRYSLQNNNSGLALAELSDISPADANFIATCSPDVVLELVARVRKAEMQLTNLCTCMDRYPDHPHPEYSRQRCPVHRDHCASSVTPHSEPPHA